MEKEFVSYQQALELKELGFDEPCFGWYASDKSLIKDYVIKMHLLAPTFSQAFRWFREKHKIGTWIHHYFNMDKGNFEYSFVITLPYKDDGYVYEKHEEAELACLNKLIEIVKNEINKN
jgi:hypothetical protein